MTRVPMVALKPMRYRTRRLQAGDRVYMTRAESVVYHAVGMASDVCSSAVDSPSRRHSNSKSTASAHAPDVVSAPLVDDAETPSVEDRPSSVDNGGAALVGDDASSSSSPCETETHSADGGATVPASDIDKLRARYEVLSGRKADRRWSESRLLREIEAAL